MDIQKQNLKIDGLYGTTQLDLEQDKPERIDPMLNIQRDFELREKARNQVFDPDNMVFDLPDVPKENDLLDPENMVFNFK